MPELPEVETVKNTLQQLVIGKTIDSVIVKWANMVKQPDDVEQFTFLLKGQTIEDIKRRGKFLKFELTDYVLVSHLRMEGKYGVFSTEEPVENHTHVIFLFSDGMELRYKDVRKFGTFHLFVKGEEEKALPLSQLGPEPFSEEFTFDYFKQMLQKTERSIKVALLDQKIVTGLGNIYVDEALFRSGIHPTRKANSLKQKESKQLHKEIILTLQEAVEKGGSTVRSYVNSQGQIGMFQLELMVYARKGEPCKKCGQEIEKMVVGQRGTHYCRNCQK